MFVHVHSTFSCILNDGKREVSWEGKRSGERKAFEPARAGRDDASVPDLTCSKYATSRRHALQMQKELDAIRDRVC